MLVGLCGCAPQRPVVYPNDTVRRVGPGVVERDIDDCLRRAEQFEASGNRGADVAQDVAGETAVGATGGAAVGAVAGAFHGGAASGAAMGAATGATAGLMHGLFGAFRRDQPSPVTANFVHRCLSERGYELIGWQ